MKRNLGINIATGVAAVGLAFGLGVAVGQSNAPTENKGVKVSAPTTLELSQEVDSIEGRQLRMRVVTIEPGGVVGLHSHKGRPAVAYLVQGTLSEHREGGADHDYTQGQAWTEDHNTVHWAENKGSTPTVVVAVDAFKPQ
jgi:quercetin dioxygenase-like cupin family protein